MIYKSEPFDFNKKSDVVGCFVQYNGEFVLLRRSKEESHVGKWGLPAGKKEQGESIEQGMLREIKEETGLKLPASAIRHYSSLYVRNDAFDMEWHMFSTNFDTRPTITINPREHSEFRWVTPQQALEIGDDLIHDLKESIQLFYGLPYSH